MSQFEILLVKNYSCIKWKMSDNAQIVEGEPVRPFNKNGWEEIPLLHDPTRRALPDGVILFTALRTVFHTKAQFGFFNPIDLFCLALRSGQQ